MVQPILWSEAGNTEHGNVQLPLPTPIFYKRGPKQIFLKPNNLKTGDFREKFIKMKLIVVSNSTNDVL